MFDRVLNALLVFYGITILRITFVEGLILLKFQVLCPEGYCENSVTNDFSRIIQNFPE